MEERLIWINNELVDVREAKISVLAPTSQFGANVFEGIRGYWNDVEKQLYIFRLDDHIKRLNNSIRLFRINSPYSNEELKRYLIDTVKANDYKCDIAIRQTIFVDGFGSWFAKEPVGMFIAPISKARKSNPLVDSESVCISSWERISEKNMSPRVKIGANYINSRLAKLEAEDNGFDAALFLNNQGFVAEGTGSCFFMVKNNKLITPKLTDSILESITRDTVITIAKNILEIEVEERSINRTELYTCDEAFFCGSAVEITPINRVDSFQVGNGESGKYTNLIHKEYIQISTGNKKEFSKWLTPVYN